MSSVCGMDQVSFCPLEMKGLMRILSGSWSNAPRETRRRKGEGDRGECEVVWMMSV